MMVNTTSPENNTESLLQRIRAEVAKRKTAFGMVESKTDIEKKQLSTPVKNSCDEQRPSFRLKLPVVTPFAVQPVFQPKADGRYHVNDLMCYHGQTFVTVAYRALMLREPDKGGSAHYLKLLRNGCSKIDILGRLRYSKEGRAAGINISGLMFPFLLRQVCRIPVFGRIVEILAAIWRLPHSERQQRIVENRTILLMEQVQNHFYESYRALNQSLTPLEDSEFISPQRRKD
jgi:hypothetical protein